ncbi:MAG TPA: glycoside hydrolase family 9 protein [Bacteroidales bacterium]|nr:glycoside hydrolase [Bacteroidales bacterium]HOU96678.1 glycoside hydrolase family 9 protein [Bacteroidales bacterium]HQG37099.1 glycoside hydrolase family 9 protein [Bacteroidales bacterium]HQG52444.1 glycoside hydrolase family 9 protein [Bacteroidales bacterium]HQJ21503.1 glycoside hydrolase family 9 protein [Bacteroidales bacterium]
MKLQRLVLFFFLFMVFYFSSRAQEFVLTSNGYFENKGVNVMAYDDIYPEGHQGGVSLIMHGKRLATNGDIRLESTPGQWQPVPKQREREVDQKANIIRVHLSYPDSARHLTDFNPMIYPDLVFNYTVTVKGEGPSIVITVDLDRPIPEKFIGKVGFNFELFPGALFGKPWIMDNQSGIFPRQPNGPTRYEPSNFSSVGNFNPAGKASMRQLAGDGGYSPIIADDIVSEPYAAGKRLVVCPDDPYSKFTIESKGSELKLYDGRMNHNNGWFVVRSEIPAGKTTAAIRWVITPNVVDDWMYTPVVQVSQVGYHPAQPKTAIIELDKMDTKRERPILYRITTEGEKKVFSGEGTKWGQFLRYNYLKFDFSNIQEEGLYQVRYGKSASSIFRIAKDVYERGVWQPVLEYFLPVQMCHMRVNEKYRVWHDCCHMDDARMAPVDFNHIDGYVQGHSTLTKYNSGDVVPGLNIGGWHDAGDFDLRVESQAGEAYILSLAYEAFKVDYDVTSIDQHKRITEIHQPDGKPDFLQQVENGVLSVVGAYRTLGRLYRGIICNNLRQYVMLGDAADMTDKIIGNKDDRWVFTENNASRELTTAAELAASSRVLKGFNDTLSLQALDCARELYEITEVNQRSRSAKIQAATELYLTTGEEKYKNYLLSEKDFIVNNIENVGWFIARAEKQINQPDFSKVIRQALVEFHTQIDKQSAETPYGIPYRPYIWGAGWDIQSLGFRLYFLHTAYPDIFGKEYIYDALNFVLGCHPGENTSSFASGVGTRSTTVAYGFNRADWTYIPGGVVSGTALIRPDFPELLRFPFLWQQVEYVMGGGSSHYMFLVLAAQQLLNQK